MIKSFLKTGKRIAAIPLFFGINAAHFLTFYLLYLFLWQYDLAYYASHFIDGLVTFALPLLGGAVIVRTQKSLKGAILSAISLSATRLVYYLLYNYLRFVNDVYDTPESIGLSLLKSAVSVVLLSLEMLLYSYVIKKLGKRENGCNGNSGPFDLNDRCVFAIFSAALIKFALLFGYEVYTTVSYFIEVGTRYRMDEVIYMLVSYMFLFIYLIASHAVAVSFSKIIVYKKEKAEETEQ